ncbi:hypothetical protein BH11PLA2_BH11PLA2_04020 [soil metagenome]
MIPAAADTRSLGRRWLDFWFAPADPTTLGFMRLITGILIVYIHLSYSFDLQAFFGVDGWLGLNDINAERKEFPWGRLSTTWEDDKTQSPPGFVPEYAHRRKAVLQYYRVLAELPKEERVATLAYVQRLQNLLAHQSQAMREGLDYVERIPSDPLARKNRLDMLIDPKLRTIVDTVPRFLEAMPDGDREKLRNELTAFLTYLPAGTDSRRYVLNHLTEINSLQRKQLLEFFYDLPADKAQRDHVMAYMEKWNNEERKTVNTGRPIFSIWFHITNPTEMAIAHGVVLIIMVMFAAGLFTKVTSVLAWLCVASYVHRTQQVLFGMDTMMNLLMIFLMIGPSGKALSIDRWRACRRVKLLPQNEATARFLAAPQKSRAAAFALRMVQIQFCFIYMAAGLSKLKGLTWWSHDAFWTTMANPEFTLIHYGFYEELIRQLASVRPLYAIAAAGMIIFTFIMELGLPFLVWGHLRPYMVIGGVLLHFGIGFFMGLILFGLLMMTLLLAYIPGEVIRSQLFGSEKKT